MKQKLLALSNFVLKYGILGLAFLMPVWVSPFSVDFFEFPKISFLIFSSFFLLIFWLLKFLMEGRVTVAKAPLNIPLFLFFLVFAAATLFSQNQYVSTSGLFGRFHGSLAELLALLILYFITVSVLRQTREVLALLYAFLASGALLSILAIAYYFGLYVLPWPAVGSRVFTLAGSPTALALYLAMLFPITLGFAFYTKEQVYKYTLLALAGLFGLVLILFNILPAFILVGVAFAIFVFWQKAQVLRENSRALLVVVGFLVFAALINYLPPLRNALPFLAVDLPREITQDVQSSWITAVHTFRDSPYLGSGPATYFYDFLRYRPLWYNTSPLWNIRFSSGANEYFGLLAQTGILGIFTFVLIFLRFLFFAFKKALREISQEEHPLKVGVTASALAFFVALVFAPSTSVTFFTFIVFLAVAAVLEKAVAGEEVEDYNISLAVGKSENTSEVAGTDSSEVEKKREVMPLLLFVPGLVLSLAVFYFLGRQVLANTNFRASLEAQVRNQGAQAYNLQLGALGQNPYEAVYHRAFAQTNLGLAIALSQKQDLNDAEKQTLTGLIDQAIREARAATSLETLNVVNWEVLAGIYRQLAFQVQNADQFAVGAFQEAIRRDPGNPQLRLDLGGLFYQADNFDQAAALFNEAVQLKPDFANGHYNLAMALKARERWVASYNEFQATKQLVPPGSEDEKRLDEELKGLEEKVREATKAAQPASPAGGLQPQQPASPSAQ